MPRKKKGGDGTVNAFERLLYYSQFAQNSKSSPHPGQNSQPRPTAATHSGHEFRSDATAAPAAMDQETPGGFVQVQTLSVFSLSLLSWWGGGLKTPRSEKRSLAVPRRVVFKDGVRHGPAIKGQNNRLVESASKEVLQADGRGSIGFETAAPLVALCYPLNYLISSSISSSSSSMGA